MARSVGAGTARAGAFIDAEQAHYPVALLCRTLRVSRSGSYAWMRRGVSARTQADEQLTEQIRQIHTHSRGTYGAPRVHAELADGHQVRCGRKRVARLMRAAGLVGCHRRRRVVRTTVADPAATPVPNQVAPDFRHAALDQLWVGDIPYVPTAEGCCISPSCSTPVPAAWWVGRWPDHLRTELALDALHMALTTRRPAGGELVHHTYRGCQYTADRYQAMLTAHAVTCSMSRAADCYNNAMAESSFGTLKAELIDRQTWPTRAAARQAIFEWVEVWYNRQRRHSALGYLSPVCLEERRAEEAAA